MKASLGPRVAANLLFATSKTARRDDPRGRRELPCWPRMGGTPMVRGKMSAAE
jgi:hypothetical protein